ncbi:hypothetical protein D3C86_767850 [compost metagenome]
MLMFSLAVTPVGKAMFTRPEALGSAASFNLVILRLRFEGILSLSVIFIVALALVTLGVKAKLVELPPVMVKITVSVPSMI